MVKSIKHVDLPDGLYRGIWFEWIVSIPCIDEDIEIPVSDCAKELKYVWVIVEKNVMIIKD